MSLNLICSTNVLTGSILSLIMVIATVCVLAIAVWLLVKFVNAKKASANLLLPLLIALGAGLVIRIVCAFIFTGNVEEHSIIYKAINDWVNYGPQSYIKREYFNESSFLYPISFYIFGFLGSSAVSAGLSIDSVLMQFIIRLPLIISDAITAFIVYRAGKKYINEYVGVILAGVVMLCPVFIFGSSVWYSVYSLLAPFIVGSFYLLANKKYEASIIVYALSMLVAKDAVYLFPIFVIYFGYIWFKSIIEMVKEGKKEKLRYVISLPVCLIVMTFVNYLITLPIMDMIKDKSVFAFINEVFINPIINAKYFANNSLSIYNVFDRGAELITVAFNDKLFAILFAILVVAFTSVIYFARKNRAVLAFAAMYVLFLLNSCYIDFSASSAILFLPLMLLSFVFIKDKRILKVFALECILIIINMCAVSTSAGYFDTVAPRVFDYLNFSILATPGYVGGMIVSITLTVLSLATFLYMTKIVMDIVMSKKCRYLGGNERIDFISAIKDFIRL